MNRPLSSLLFFASVAGPLLAQSPAPDFSSERILERVKVLSSDEFEGRAPGSPGEEKTVAYLVSQFKALGLAPGNPDGTYIQPVPLIGITSQTTARFDTGSTSLSPVWINDYVAISRRFTEQVSVKDADVVFAGYGVVAPEYGWDDFKDVDVRGKTIIVLVNDPQIPDPKDPSKLDDSMFKGKAMTYYGRWMYKYEEASRKGAAACLIVHETRLAGYPFAVVAASNGRENFDLARKDGNRDHVAVEGWLTLDAAQKLVAACGYDLAALKARALRRDFRPVSLGAKATFTVHNTLREVASNNVIARLPGADPKRAPEVLVYSAHWDHLGRDPRLKGDQIYNGAEDNATGVATLLEIARGYAGLPAAERPGRSIIFLAVTAEEKGLLGARYYAENPLYPLNRTVADINMDRVQVLGPARDLEVPGLGNSDLDSVAERVAKAQGRVLTPDSTPQDGHFYRSDHFEFAKVGVPSFYSIPGVDIIGKPPGYGESKHAEYFSTYYHKVTDDIKPWWNLEGAASEARFYFALGYEVARSTTWPQWNPGCEFKAIRDRSLAEKP